MNAIFHLIVIELKLFLREPIAVFFTLIFPFIPLGLFGTLFGDQPAMPGFRVIDVYVPALIAMVIAYFGLMGLPIALSENREQGVLKRYKASPMGLGRVLGSHLVVQVVLLAVVTTVLALVAELVFDITFAGNLLLLVTIGVIGCLALFTLGFAVVGACPSARTTQAVGSVIFFLMLFFSGAAIPRRQFPPWLKEATDWIPLSHLVDLLTVVWVGDPLGDQRLSIYVLLAIAVVCGVLSRYTFRWEP